MELWRRWIGDGRPIIVAADSGDIVGFAVAGFATEPNIDIDFQLYAINVRQAYWGSGVAQRLHDRSVGDRAAFLWVLRDNIRARASYVRNGYRSDGAESLTRTSAQLSFGWSVTDGSAILFFGGDQRRHRPHGRFRVFSTSFEQAAAARALLAFLVKAGEPSSETLHGSLKLRMEVDEGAQLISQPREGDLIFPSTCLELLDSPIGEVHIYSQARLAHGAGKLVSSSLFAQCDRGELGSPETQGIALIVPPITSARLRRSPSVCSYARQAYLAERDPSCTYAKAASIRARCCCR